MKLRIFLLLMVSSFAGRGADLLVAAAADLGPLTANLDKGFEAVSHVKVKFSLESSGSLAKQIENGAPYDVFLSADERYVKQLVSEGHLEANTFVYALGRLGLWSKDGRVKSFADLNHPEFKHIAIANPEHAPYGIAARKALETQGLWRDLQPKIVYGENVRQAMQFADSGNADAVITSWTLLIGRGSLLPAEWHDPIRQSGGIVKSSAQISTARQFLQFLMSPGGRKILQAGGLFPP